MVKRIVSCLALLTLLAGCGGVTIDYENSLVEVQAAPVTSEVIAIAVRDQRGWAIKHPRLLGVARTTMGIPLDVNTRSGRPFTDDVAHALCTSLEQTGYRPVQIEVDPGMTPENVVRKLRESGHDRWLLVEIGGWRSDGYFGELTLFYRVAAKVYASDGLRSTTRKDGQESMAYANRDSYPGACRHLFGQVFTELLADVELAPPLASAGPEVEPCGTCQAELQPAWSVCPICASPR